MVSDSIPSAPPSPPPVPGRPVRVAIALRDHRKFSETFVRRHIAHLFGGRTTVIALTGAADPGDDRPVLVTGPVPRPERLTDLGHPWRMVGAHVRQAGQRRRLRAFLRATGTTHVLCEFGYVCTELGPMLLETGLPVFCYFRGNDASAQLRNPAYVARLAALFPRLAGVFAVSRFLLDNLAAAGLVHPNAHVIPSGTDVDVFRPEPGPVGPMLSVGRFVAKKSPVLLIEALSRLSDLPDLRLDIVGDGPEQEQARALTARLGLAGRVAFPGRLTHDEVRQRMGRALAYVQHFDTSPDGDTEGMPSVIQEAMAAGRAIVTTRHAGIPEHVRDGETGLLCEPGDGLALAEAIRRVATDAGLRARLGAAARDHALAELDYRLLYRRAETVIAGGRA